MSIQPTIALLEPPANLSNGHHGAANNSRIELAADTTPTAFHNPWPSYRFATLNDAWVSYQKGAAIATPQLLHVPEKDMEAAISDTIEGAASTLRGDTNKPRSNSGVGRLFYDPDDDEDSDTPADAEDDDDDEDNSQDENKSQVEQRKPENITFPAKVHPLEPVRGYVRPELTRILSADNSDDWREPPLRVEAPHWPDGARPAATWLGHASVLVQIPWRTTPGSCGILFDPIFSYRCSPIQQVGPARSLDVPCQVDELPPVNLCLISHDHYDHLDYNTILQLWECHQSTVHFIVPLGLKKWFESCGIPSTRITELDWWHEAIINYHSSPDTETTYPPTTSAPKVDPDANLTLKIACTPAQHRSGRGLMDQMSTLWASWVVGVVTPSNSDALKPGMKGDDWPFKVYFGGDTGYRYASAPDEDNTAICPAFKEIGEAYGPVDLALLPLSTGSSLPFLRKLLLLSLDQYTLTSSQHCSPADSLDIHAAVKAKRSLGIHWGTFCDAAEARATRVEFGRARREKNVSSKWDDVGQNGAFVICDIGDTVVIP